MVFASIQTLQRNLDRFESDRFDYVVVDEFHHAAAPTYRRAIEGFRPKFLLGLTATPDRLDGADLLALCGNNLVFECDLVEGIRQERLSPFHYWGIKDVADYAPIPWRNGRFDPDKLAEAIETTQRAEQALEEWRERAAGPTLAFCTTIAHAEFMAEFFNRDGEFAQLRCTAARVQRLARARLKTFKAGPFKCCSRLTCSTKESTFPRSARSSCCARPIRR